jgi:hypothetical protein
MSSELWLVDLHVGQKFRTDVYDVGERVAERFEGGRVRRMFGNGHVESPFESVDVSR